MKKNKIVVYCNKSDCPCWIRIDDTSNGICGGNIDKNKKYSNFIEIEYIEDIEEAVCLTPHYISEDKI